MKTLKILFVYGLLSFLMPGFAFPQGSQLRKPIKLSLPIEVSIPDTATGDPGTSVTIPIVVGDSDDPAEAMVDVTWTGNGVTTQPQVLDNIGDDFILAFMPNFDASVTIELHLTSNVITNVTVQYPVNFPIFTTTVPVTPGAVTIVSLPITSATAWIPNNVSNNCVHVFAPDDFVCYTINRRSFSSDAALALPVDVMNTEYIAMTYNARGGGGEFTVYAGFDNTTVTITPKNAIVGHSAGTPFTVTLNRGEGYHAQSAAGSGPNGSLAGSLKSLEEAKNISFPVNIRL